MLVYGIIIKVQSYSSEKEAGILRVENLNDNKRYSLKYRGFLPVHNLDSIKGYVDEKLFFKEKPLVVPVETLDYLKQSLMSQKIGYKKCSDFMEELNLYSGSVSNIYKNLNTWASDKATRNFNTTILSSIQIDKFLNWWKKNYLTRRLYLLGLKDSEIKYSFLDLNSLYERLKFNPYSLQSITIEKADGINKILEKDFNKYNLVGANIIRMIHKSGWTCMPFSYISKAFPEIHVCLDYIKEKFPLVFVDKYVYNEYCYKMENYLSDKVKTMLLRMENEKLLNLDMPKAINAIVKDEKITLTEEQIKALEGSLENHISIISGGAGCGKTTLIKNIIKNLEYRKVKYALTSFTGKAVLRMKEVLGEEYAKHCYTIHLLIQKKKFHSKPPRFETLIIDEASMIAGGLIYEFFSLYKHYYKIILVGDTNQLPPIGVCNFFKELILSKKIPLYYLTINKRIVDNIKSANILKNANLLISGKLENFVTGNGFEIIYGDKKIVNKIVYSLSKASIKMENITVLTPYNKDLEEINNYARKVFLAGKEVYDYDSKKYIVGDRVMQIVNVYGGEEIVMNGEEGTIFSINGETLKIKYNDTKYIDYKWSYDKKSVKKDKESYLEASEKDFYSCDLKHSFCKTVHKSQGSEYDYVIIYLPAETKNSDFVNINLLYTAITRTKKTVWIVCDKNSLYQATKTKIKDNYDRLSIKINEP